MHPTEPTNSGDQAIKYVDKLEIYFFILNLVFGGLCIFFSACFWGRLLHTRGYGRSIVYLQLSEGGGACASAL